MDFHFIEEYRISNQLRANIQELLQKSFMSYPDRHYYKQLPAFRFYVSDAGQVVAHVAVEHRIISIDHDPIRIFGIVDLCVDDDYSKRGIAGELIQRVEHLGVECGIDFVLLFADDHRIYKNKGYQSADNICKWLMINEHQTLGVAKRSLADCILFKSIGTKDWVSGELDLMGTVF
ncbi:MAG: GNAT family N-acetyltransferase [Bacteroidota bacterium]